MTDVASQVPGRYDVVINGHGYTLWNALLQNLPFRYQKAAYSYSKTFIERSNVSGSYGDNSQDFWLTASQDDWSGGEQQKFLRVNDRVSTSKFWQGSKVDIRTQGAVTMRPPFTSVSFGTAVSACAPRANQNISRNIIALGAANLYDIDENGTVTDNGAHGLGATPSTFGLTTDGSGDTYFTTTAAGTVGIRKWTGAAFSTFSATPALSLAYLNNALYGVDASALMSYSTGGVATTLYTWRQIDGTAGIHLQPGRLKAFGGNLLISWVGMQNELWQYDGTSTYMVARFPENVSIHEIEEVYGVVFISANVLKGLTGVRPTIFTYLNGSLDLLWQSDTVLATGASTLNYAPAMASFDGGLAFTDDTTGRLMFYDPTTGAIHGIGTYTVTDAKGLLASSIAFMLHTRAATTSYYFPGSGTSSTSTVITSLTDFDLSLTKLFRGVIVDFDVASDGDGGSVDIAYQTGMVTGSFTNLKTGATGGTEYTLSGVSGRSITVKVTLNKGTSTAGPVLKRIYVRAAPVQQSYRRCQYVLDLGGDAKLQDPVPFRDGTYSTLTGLQMATNLVTAITSATPISVTDRFGTYTAVFEQGEGITEMDEVRPGEFVAQVTLREV